MDDSEQYAKCLQFYQDDIPELLLKYISDGKWTSLLDLGCGDGSLLYAMRRKGYLEGKTVHAIDISRQRIRRVQLIDSTFECRTDDAGRLDTVASESIDVLVSTQVIEHVPDEEAMIQSMERSISKGGTAYLSTVFKKPPAWYFYRNNGRWVLDPTHVREYSDERVLLSKLEKHGFVILENRKTLILKPVLGNFVLARIRANNDALSRHPVLALLRRLKLPVPGYYNWEIVARKGTRESAM